MSLSDKLAAAALVLSVLGIAAAIYYGRKGLRPPKRQLRWRFSADPLFTEATANWRSAVEVKVLTRPVRDPYFATLTLTNAGREDLASATFDQSRPIVFRVQGKVGTIQPLSTSTQSVVVDGDRVQFTPNLLRSGESWVVNLITEGRTQALLQSSYLLGTEIVQDRRAEATRNAGVADGVGSTRRSLLLALASAGAALVGVTVNLLSNVYH